MAFKTGIRPLNPTTDLQAVADLIEICFADHMDADGREFVRYLRQIAKDRFARFWMTGASASELSPLGGFVWIERGRIIGNLSLIPFRSSGRTIYLIANVAVHPDFRRQGIGGQLTQQAIREVTARKASETWLHVRIDNPGAYKLYLDLGFQDNYHRTTWEADQRSIAATENPQLYKITSRRHLDWSFQKEWLELNYPLELRWNLPIKESMIRPSILNEITHFLENDPIQQFCLRNNGELLGVVTWQPSIRHADYIWLAGTKKNDKLIIGHLLPDALNRLSTNKPFVLNYPEGRGDCLLPVIGFKKINTLAWMKLV